MITVYKYTFRLEDEISATLPAGAKILDCQMQNLVPCIWALVDTDAPLTVRRFRLAGTGHPITQSPDELQHIATFQPQPGLVFHLFEIL